MNFALRLFQETDEVARRLKVSEVNGTKSGENRFPAVMDTLQKAMLSALFRTCNDDGHFKVRVLLGATPDRNQIFDYCFEEASREALMKLVAAEVSQWGMPDVSVSRSGSDLWVKWKAPEGHPRYETRGMD